jgi:hypothetical protein
MDLMRFRDNEQWILLNAKNGVFYLEDTSNNSNYKVNIVDDIELFPGFIVNLKVNTDNTGASTFSIDNGVTNKDIVKGINTPTETGDINANQIIELVYDGTKWRLRSPELINQQKRFFSSFTATTNNTTTCPINNSMFNKDDSALDIVYEGALLLEGVNFDIATSGEDVDLNFSINTGERLDYIITKNIVSTLSGSYIDPVDKAGDTMTGNLTAPRFISNVSEGTAPLQVTSTTKVSNLNVDMLNGIRLNNIVSGDSGKLLRIGSSENLIETVAHIGSGGSVHAAATTSVNGFMSSTDKTKLDGIEAGAQVNVATNIAQGTRTTTSVPITSSTGTGATLDVATTSLAGVMSSADKTKLDGIATSANNYVHPSDGGGSLASLTGAVVISGITVNTAGHVTGTTTRSLTAANISAEPAFTKNTAFNKNYSTTNPLVNGTVAVGTADNVSRGDHVHPTDTSRASASISITAGNGLTGGGTLEASRTLAIGTPGTLTDATDNGVTSTSHTHKLQLHNIGKLSTYRSNKDSESIYTTITYKRSDSTNYAVSVLSGGTTPLYTTRTETFYDTDGTTVLSTNVYTLTYDVDGLLESEVLN